MVDASSVLGAIGFASNCINILLTTISKAEERTDEFRKCRQLFKAHVRKLACVQRRLSGWRVQWSYFSLEDYKAFWGDENVSEVQSRLEDIQTTANGILNDAQRGDRSEECNSLDNGVEIQIESRDQSVWHDWRSLIKAMHLSSHRDPKALVPNSNETTLMFKIAFIIFKNDSLKRNIDELEAAVADLDAFCQQIFNHRRGDMEAKKVTRSMLERSSRHKDFVRPLSIFATTLYKAQSHSDCPFRWGLELRLPDTHGDCLTWDQTHQLDLDFIVMSNVSGGSMEYSRVRIRYRPDNKDMNDAASVLPLSIVSGTAENADFERLDAPQRRSKPFSEIFKSQLLANDKNLYMAWTRERLDLMLGFTNWMFLLWDTQWTSQPCCCGIRFEQIRRNTRCHVLACQRGHSCHELLDTQHKLLSLGVVLAELTLAKHLRVRFADMDFEDQLSCQPKYPLSSTLDQGRKRCPTVQLWRTDGNGTWQDIPRERLLQDIRERSHSLELADIIEKCLYDHQMITKNPIEFLDFYNEEILKP